MTVLGAARIAQVRSWIMPFVQGRDEDIEFRAADPVTRRSFHLYDCGERGFFMAEVIPSGRMAEADSRGYIRRGWDEPRLAQIEAAEGPNGFWSAYEAAGFDPENLVQDVAGFSVDSRYLASLDECASEIARCLEDNVRYCARREVTPDERAQRKLLDRHDTLAYWDAESRLIAAAEADSHGFLKGAHSMFGPIGADARNSILAYVNEPSQERWLEIRGTIVAGVHTLWSAWCHYDSDAPRSGDAGFPRGDVLREAVKHAIESRKSEASARRAKADQELSLRVAK